jgi:hypothetical protein
MFVKEIVVPEAELLTPWFVDIAEKAPDIGEPLSAVIGNVARLDVCQIPATAPPSKSPENGGGPV